MKKTEGKCLIRSNSEMKEICHMFKIISCSVQTAKKRMRSENTDKLIFWSKNLKSM